MNLKHSLIKMRDILLTDLLYLVPCLIKWFYQLKIRKEITVYPITNVIGRKAKLYQHGQWPPEEKDSQAVLFLHGVYSHPFVMLHLAKEAQKAKLGPVFSVYLS